MRLNRLTQYLIYQLYHAAVLASGFSPEWKSEEIHQFRVSLRRIRSLVKLYLKASLPFPDELKAAAKATNPIRELDVLIESLPSLKYPKTSRLLIQMRRERCEELFTEGFKKQSRQAIRSYYDTLCDTNPDISEKHLIGTVEKHFEQYLSVYRSMDDNASQKEMHRLRVGFKNARYGFEFLREAGVWDEPEKIGVCKMLQNSLGAVQDAYNQIDWLKKLYRRHPCSETEKLLKERRSALKKLKAASRSARSPGHTDTRSSG